MSTDSCQDWWINWGVRGRYMGGWMNGFVYHCMLDSLRKFCNIVVRVGNTFVHGCSSKHAWVDNRSPVNSTFFKFI